FRTCGTVSMLLVDLADAPLRFGEQGTLRCALLLQFLLGAGVDDDDGVNFRRAGAGIDEYMGAGSDPHCILWFKGVQRIVGQPQYLEARIGKAQAEGG